VSFSWREQDKGLKALFGIAKERARPYVKVGVMGDGGKNTRPGDPITNVELALIQEFGSPTNNIPARSFIRAPFQAKKAEYAKMLARLVEARFRALGKDLHKGWDAKSFAVLGEKIAADLKANMPGTPPPNAESTLKKKLALTRAGSLGEPQTLVDTGRLLNSITYAVVTK
jgi:hypothetical protein